MPDTDWFEGDMLPIEVQNPGGLARRAFVNFTMLDAGSVEALDTLRENCANEATVRCQVELPRVADTAAGYQFTFKSHVDDEDETDSDTYTVWPKSIHITAKYRKIAGDATDYADGDPVYGFPFAVIQDGIEGNDDDLVTGQDGTRTAAVKAPAPSMIKAELPWIIVDPAEQSNTVRRREIHVRKLNWVAKIRSHAGGNTEENPLRQYVQSAAGSLIRIEVGPEDLDDAVKDETVYIRVTFPRANSKRNDPSPGVWMRNVPASARQPDNAAARPGLAVLKFEFELKIPADSQPVVFYIQMGIAGGDKCQIETGVTRAYESDLLWIRNWRKLKMELLIPRLTLRQKCTALLADNGAAFSADVQRELAKIFSDSFVDFEYPAAGCVELNAANFKTYWKGTGDGIEEAPIDRNASLFVPRNKILVVKKNPPSRNPLPQNDSDTVSLLCPDHNYTLREENIAAAKSTDTMTWTITDFIVERSETNVIGPAIQPATDLTTVKNFFEATLDGVAESAELELPFHVFDYDPIAATDCVGLHRVTWAATHFALAGTTDWTPITTNNHPRGQDRNPHVINVTSIAIRDKWCALVNSGTIKAKLPTDAATDPGNLVLLTRNEPTAVAPDVVRNVNYIIRIAVRFEFYGVQFSTAIAACLKGSGYLQTYGGTMGVRPLAEIMAHEIGHNCGQAYTPRAHPEVGGWTGQAIPGIPFDRPFPDSRYYVGNGHTGPHCANGLLDAMKILDAQPADFARVAAGGFQTPAADDITAYFRHIASDDHCIMWGAAHPNSVMDRHFCEECKRRLRAVELTDVCKAW